MPKATKLGKMVTYLERLLPIMLPEPLAWSSKTV